MPTNTTNLKLFKYDTTTDGKMTFNINNALNGNFDKIDQFAGQIDDSIAIFNYSASGVYNAGDWVAGFVNNKKGIFTSLINDNINNPLTDEDCWQEVELGGGSVRNLGELVQTLLPQSDAGLHLVDGAILDGNGAYSQFVNYIANLYRNNPELNCFTTEEDWQASVDTYGVCAKFVYNSRENTVRLPKVTGLVEGTLDADALGELVQAGLPVLKGTAQSAGAHTHTRGTMNITGNLTSWSASGAFSLTSTDTNLGFQNGGMWGNVNKGKCSFNASRNWTGATSTNGAHEHNVSVTDNNGIVGRSNTVQPQTVKGYLYIVVGTSVKTDIQINIDNVITDLNNKADRDLSNITWTNEMRQIVANIVGEGLINGIATEDTQGIVMPDNETIKISDNGTISTVVDPNDYYTKDEVDGKVANLYRIKGHVSSYNNLPATGNHNGDVYNVLDTGENYVWVGISENYPDGWDNLRGIIDFSNYYTKTEVNALLQTRDTQISNLSSYIVDLQTRVTALETLIQGGNA